MFQTPLDLRATDEPGLWRVIAPLVWEDAELGQLVVPAGTITDLASIPVRLRGFGAFGWYPFDPNGESRRPAVLHDWLYADGTRGKDFADRALRAALLAEGVSRGTANAFYYAVKWFGGSAWKGHRRRAGAPA